MKKTNLTRNLFLLFFLLLPTLNVCFAGVSIACDHSLTEEERAEINLRASPFNQGGEIKHGEFFIAIPDENSKPIYPEIKITNIEYPKLLDLTKIISVSEEEDEEEEE